MEFIVTLNLQNNGKQFFSITVSQLAHTKCFKRSSTAQDRPGRLNACISSNDKGLCLKHAIKRRDLN